VAVACALVGWVVYVIKFQGIKEWDVDAQGPVLVSTDGQSLTLTGVPDPAWSPGECLGSLSVDLVTEEHPATVAVHFHLRSVPLDPGGPRGSCARFTGFRAALPRPLDARTLTDSHGRPLRTVSEAGLPRPHDPALTEDRSELCVAGVQQYQQISCLGSTTLVRHYSDASKQPVWTLYQSLDPTAPNPADPATQAVQRTDLNGAPAVCTVNGYRGVIVAWTAAGTAQQLQYLPRTDSGATDDELCTRAVAEARTVS
jgi:hypothetical protein